MQKKGWVRPLRGNERRNAQLLDVKVVSAVSLTFCRSLALVIRENRENRSGLLSSQRLGHWRDGSQLRRTIDSLGFVSIAEVRYLRMDFWCRMGNGQLQGRKMKCLHESL